MPRVLECLLLGTAIAQHSLRWMFAAGRAGRRSGAFPAQPAAAPTHRHGPRLRSSPHRGQRPAHASRQSGLMGRPRSTASRISLSMESTWPSWKWTPPSSSSRALGLIVRADGNLAQKTSKSNSRIWEKSTRHLLHCCRAIACTVPRIQISSPRRSRLSPILRGPSSVTSCGVIPTESAASSTSSRLCPSSTSCSLSSMALV